MSVHVIFGIKTNGFIESSIVVRGKKQSSLWQQQHAHTVYNNFLAVDFDVWTSSR